MVLSRRVLLLNASYEALGTVDVPRAVRLVWKRTAQVVVQDEKRVLRSQHFTFEVPSVIRLLEYIDVRKRRNNSGKQRLRIMMRDKMRCQYCGVRGNAFELTLDHIMPRSRGGNSNPENLCASCIQCNQRKGNRTPDEARMPLLTTPSALRYGLDRAVLNHYALTRPEWRPFLFLDEEARIA
ncbi:MAG TPA: HNH endonuclease [Pyrinomonadaceae bacterium]|jgi:5-methylcytosine-specific restriction endonuclease McrA